MRGQTWQPMSETWAAADGTLVTIRPISAADLASSRSSRTVLGVYRISAIDVAQAPIVRRARRFTDITLNVNSR